MRLLITGGVGAGKTTLADKMGDATGTRVYHTDDLIQPGNWSEVSQHVADKWLTMTGPWIIEGVAIPRALRKYQEAHPHEPPPCDRIIVLTDSNEYLNPRQEAMSRTVYEHMADLAQWLGPGLVEWR